MNERVFELHDEGLTAGKIAQKLKIKKAVVLDILGDAANKGLGDTVEKITEATGIKAVVETVAKALDSDCGCKARKETLNKLFPNRKLNDLSEDDYNYLDKYFAEKRHSVSSKEQKELVRIYNDIFNAKRVVSNCSPCVASVVRELKRIYEAAND
jgi:hypothetical protein